MQAGDFKQNFRKQPDFVGIRQLIQLILAIRESEEALGNITASIKQSFAESTAPECKAPTERHSGKQERRKQHHPPQDAAGTGLAKNVKQAQTSQYQSNTTSAFENVMKEMDQVFNRLLKEDVGKSNTENIFLNHQSFLSLCQEPSYWLCIAFWPS